MAIFKRSLIFLFALVLILVSAFFIMRNSHVALLDLVFLQVEWPLIVFILLAFLTGVLLSWLLNAWVLIVQKRQIKQLNKRLADCEQEVSQLRRSPMNGMQ